MKINIVPLEKIEIDGKSIELAIDYDENDSVEFIEFLGGIEGTLHPVIYGKPVFESNADELFEILKQHNNGEIDDMKADGIYDQGYVDDELKKANHWATIGIGKENYYKN